VPPFGRRAARCWSDHIITFETVQDTLQTVLYAVPPAWILAVLLALLNVLVFRLVMGREGHSTLYFLPFGIFGFALGNLIGAWSRLPIPSVGDVRLVEASLGAWLLLTLANLRQPAA
jgi:hypothetical protein